MKQFALAAVAALISTPALAQDATPEPLRLVCEGTSTFQTSEYTSASASAYGTNGGATAYGSETTTRTAKAPDRLRLEIEGAAGRIKVPRNITPPINTGGKDGWWSFTELETSPDQIVAKFKLNVLNRVKVVIDRRTGDVDLKGLGMSFSGSCERSKDDPSERKF